MASPGSAKVLAPQGAPQTTSAVRLQFAATGAPVHEPQAVQDDAPAADQLMPAVQFAHVLSFVGEQAAARYAPAGQVADEQLTQAPYCAVAFEKETPAAHAWQAPAPALQP